MEGDRMTVVHISRGGSMTQETYEQVSAQMGTEQDPPPGLIVHTAAEVDGVWQVVDIWESADAKERFEQDRLMPAISALFGPEAASTPEGQPESVAYEASHTLVP
jgi:hypothetical protein